MVGSLALPLFFSLLFSLLTLFFSFHTLFLNPHEFCCVGTRTADKQQLQMGRLCRLEEQTCPQRPPRRHGGGLLRAGCVRYLFFSDSNKLRFLGYWNIDMGLCSGGGVGELGVSGKCEQLGAILIGVYAFISIQSCQQCHRFHGHCLPSCPSRRFPIRRLFHNLSYLLDKCSHRIPGNLHFPLPLSLSPPLKSQNYFVLFYSQGFSSLPPVTVAYNPLRLSASLLAHVNLNKR